MKALPVLIALTLCAAPALAQHPSSPDRGLSLYSAYCAGCHGFEGRGDGPMAPGLQKDTGVRPIDLTDPAFQERLNDKLLARAIREGGVTHRTGFMPAWGLTLSEPQLDDLVAYIRELRNPDRPQTARSYAIQKELDLGRVLYGLRCLACHGADGKGQGPFLENLSLRATDFTGDYLLEVTDRQLGETIGQGLDHAHMKGMQSGWWERPLDPKETQALIFYLRTLKVQDAEGR